MSKTPESLDADELLHLAIQASAQGNHEQAITALKRAIGVAPNEGKLHYMLGAEHAQIGMYDRAAEEMARAVELDPKLDTARFQLGLLHLTSGRVEQATNAWKPLESLGAEHPLYLFKTGLLHLVRDEFDECAKHLNKGIALNQANAALNNDMRQVLRDIDKQLQANSTSAKPATPAKAAAAPKHVLLSAYRQNRDDDKDKD
ncbi:MAG: tetratricopeptide repeat protein [Gammaproteobacteria bacterium]|nr:tetratricopeptide repeat protein [Gammaproteobacteria bacterium]